MNFPFNIAFIVCHKFGYVVWSFSLNFRKSLISSLTHCWFMWELFNIHVSVGFLKLVLLLNFNFKLQRSEKINGVISIFFICWGFLCYLVCVQFLRRFNEVLRRRYILLFLNVTFYRCLLSPFESYHLIVLLFLC